MHRSPLGFSVLTRYEDVVAGLRSRMLGASRTADKFRALYGGGPTLAFASVGRVFRSTRAHPRRAAGGEGVHASAGRGDASADRRVAERLLDRLEGRRGRADRRGRESAAGDRDLRNAGCAEAEQAQLSDWAGTIPFIIRAGDQPGRLAAADAALRRVHGVL